MRTTFILTTGLAIAIGLFAPPRARSQNPASATNTTKTGTALYLELRCGLCHDVPANGINIPPSLANAGDKFQTEWLATYLKTPYRRRWASANVRPTLRMPNFLLSDEEAETLAFFLTTKRDSTFSKKPVFALPQKDSAKIAEGKQIYQEYACYGCHRVDDKGGEVGPDLNGVGSRLKPEYLAAFLQNPQVFIPRSSMKISELWEEEVQALAAYLMSLK